MDSKYFEPIDRRDLDNMEEGSDIYEDQITELARRLDICLLRFYRYYVEAEK